MTVRNLEFMFEPHSLALIGASTDEGTVGFTTARNIVTAGFKGPIHFVNPHHAEILGHPCVPSIADLPHAPDLAIIATPPQTVPGVISELGAKGTRAAVVITAGLTGDIKAQMLDAARPYLLRILGPNCLGLMLPHLGVNASFAHRNGTPGDLAFISQSGALVTAVLDWTTAHNIGFSHIISLGDMADVDFGDLLDLLSADAKSRAILLYMEAVTHPAKFMSAARRAARVKPVIIVKSGRHEAGAIAALSHTGRLAGADGAYDAAFRRAGLLRVKTLTELFAAAGTLSRSRALPGERLAILTNGGGAGVLAADEVQDLGGTLAKLSPETMHRLGKVLPATWSHGNPVDIIGDADYERYHSAMEALLEDTGTDAILVIQCPTAITSSTETARAVIQAVEHANSKGHGRKLVLTNWLGEEAAAEARHLFDTAKIPTFETPSEAIAGYSQLARYSRAGRELAAAPAAQRAGIVHDWEAVNVALESALKRGTKVLTEVAAKEILAHYGLPVAPAHVAFTPKHVKNIAAKILSEHGACVVKILSADLTHKSDVGGVRLGLETPQAAVQAAEEMIARVRSLHPDAVIEGFMVEPMIRRPNAQEIIIGMTVDATFGPMILFGAGGTSVEVVADTALALPPLDRMLAQQLIASTRISKLLHGYRDHAPADLDALADALVTISELVVRHPEIREIDVNPLIIDEHGLLALDARIKIEDERVTPRAPLSIMPYPIEWDEVREVGTIGRVRIRPIKPDDHERYREFISKLSPDDIRLRFFSPRRSLSPQLMARLTQIDYAREMAFVAEAESGEILGVVRLVLDPDHTTGEYGIIIRSDLKGKGLGGVLMQRLIDYGRKEGLNEITGLVLTENTTMLELTRKLGFKSQPVEDDATVRNVILTLKSG